MELTTKNNIKKMTIEQLARHFIKLLQKKEKLEEDLKFLNSSISFVDNTLADKMLEDDVTVIEIDGIRLQPQIDETFSITSHKWDDDRFFNWLKSIGEDALIKIKKSGLKITCCG